MPLYRKKELDLIPIPDVPAMQKVWKLELTGEVFTTYTEYADRLSLLNSKHFSCSMTGRKNLTYAEALKSEKRQEELISSLIPNEQVKPLAKLIHYNTLTLVKIIEFLYKHFSKSFSPDDKVTVECDGGDKFIGLIKEKHTYSECQELASKYQIIDNSHAGGNFYLVSSVNDLEKNFLVHESRLKRVGGFSPPKKSIRRIVKTMARRGTAVGSPWIIREHIINKYDLSNHISQNEVQFLSNGVSIKPKKKYSNSNSKHQFRLHANSNSPIPRPIPSSTIGTVPASHFGSLVESWTFLTTFSKFFNITHYTFDQFLSSISLDYSQSDIPESISDSFSSLLSLLCSEYIEFIPFIRKKLGLPISKLNKKLLSNCTDKYFIDHNGIIFHKSPYGNIHQVEESGLIEVSDAHSFNFEPYPDNIKQYFSSYLYHYNNLSIDKKNALDHWYTWSTDIKPSFDLLSSFPSPNNNTKIKKKSTPHSYAEKFGWELVLVGYIRDCITVHKWPEKWEFINKVLSDPNPTFHPPSLSSNGVSSDHKPYYNLRSPQTTPISITRAAKFGLRERKTPAIYNLTYGKKTPRASPPEDSLKHHWLHECSSLISSSKAHFSQLPLSTRIFLLYTLTRNINRSKKLREYIFLTRSNKKILLDMKRSIELDRRCILKRPLDAINDADQDTKAEVQNKLLKKESTYRKLLSTTNSIKSLSMIGRDRFFSRYWWFDEQLGCIPLKSLLKPENSSIPITYSYLCGYLFVEILSDSTHSNSNNESDIPKFRSASWAFYDSPIQFVRLLEWLSQGGTSDSSLLRELIKLKDVIIFRMNKRLSQQNTPNLE